MDRDREVDHQAGRNGARRAEHRLAALDAGEREGTLAVGEGSGTVRGDEGIAVVADHIGREEIGVGGEVADDPLDEGHLLDQRHAERSEEHTSELQSLMRISYAVFCLKKKKTTNHNNKIANTNNKEQLHNANHTTDSDVPTTQ